MTTTIYEITGCVFGKRMYETVYDCTGSYYTISRYLAEKIVKASNTFLYRDELEPTIREIDRAQALCPIIVAIGVDGTVYTEKQPLEYDDSWYSDEELEEYYSTPYEVADWKVE